jgi:WD40 repeat protein
MLHIGEADMIATASMDGLIQMFSINHSEVAKTYSGHSTSSGVKAISYSKQQKYVVSAADRVIEVWDAFTIELVYSMPEVEAPIVDVYICDAEELIIAASTNKVMHLWNAITFELLQTVFDHTVYRPFDVLSAICYCQERQHLYSAGNRVTSWVIQHGAQSDRSSDNDGDVCAVLLNSVFKLVIIVTTLGTVDVFQAQSGSVVRRFYVAGATGNPSQRRKDPHSGLPLAVVKHACLDKRQRRLLVNTFDDRIELWNFNNSQLLSEFRPMISSLKDPLPTGLDSLSRLSSSSVASDGSKHNAKMNFEAHAQNSISCMLYDTAIPARKGASLRKYIIVGTEQGLIYGCEELAADVDNTPTITFRRPVKPRVRRGQATLVPRNRMNSSLSGIEDSLSLALAGDEIDNSIVYLDSAADSKCLVSYGDGGFFVWDMLQPQNSVEVDATPTAQILHCMGAQHDTKAPRRDSKHHISKLFGHDRHEALLGPADHTGDDHDDAMGKIGGRREAKAEIVAGGMSVHKSHFEASDKNKQHGKTLAFGTAFQRTSEGTTVAPNPHAATTSLVTGLRREATVDLTGDYRLQPRAPDVSMMSRSSFSFASHSGSVLGNTFSTRNYGLSILSGRVRTLHNSDTGQLLSGQSSQIGSGSVVATSSNIQLAKLMLADIAQAAGDVQIQDTTDFSCDTSGNKLAEHSLSPVLDSVNAVAPDKVSPKQKIAGRLTARLRTKTVVHDAKDHAVADNVSMEPIHEEDVDHSQAPSEPKITVPITNSPATIRRKGFRGSSFTGMDDGTAAADGTVVADGSHAIRKPSVAVPTKRSIRSSTTPTDVRIQSTNKLDKLLRTNFVASSELLRNDHSPTEKEERVTHVIVEDRYSDTHEATTGKAEFSVAHPSTVEGDELDNDEVPIPTEADLHSQSVSLSIDSDSVTRHSTIVPAEPVVVECCLYMNNPPLIVSGCSDGYIRFWDWTSLKVLCSCFYCHKPTQWQLTALQAANFMAGAHRSTHGHGRRRHSNRFDEGSGNKPPEERWPVTEKLKLLRMNGNEDRLVGAYESGMIRVWVVVTHSLLTLEKLHSISQSTTSASSATADSTLGSGLAISPLQLLFEWEAHSSPILSIDFVWFDLDSKEDEGNDDESSPLKSPRATAPDSPTFEENSSNTPGDSKSVKRSKLNQQKRIFVEELHSESMNDGFILSAGLDQRVALWTLKGECLGRYGTELWDINDARTWRSTRIRHGGVDDIEGDADGAHASMVVLESTLSSNIPKARKLHVQTDAEKKQLADKKRRLRSVRATTLNTYVRNLVTKINARPPLSHEQNTNFAQTIKEHPVVNVDKFIADNPRFAASSIAKRMAKFKNAS